MAKAFWLRRREADLLMSVFFIAGHKFGRPGMQWTTKARKMRKAQNRIDEAFGDADAFRDIG
jgi:hypothetical protein